MTQDQIRRLMDLRNSEALLKTSPHMAATLERVRGLIKELEKELDG